MDRFQINLIYVFILSAALSGQIDLCNHTRISCLRLFWFSRSIFVATRGDHACLYFLFTDRSWWEHKETVLAFIFCFWVDLSSTTLLSDCFLLEHVTGVSALLRHFGKDDQSRYFLVPFRYCYTISTRSCRWWILFLAYIVKSLSCRFPVELRSCFSAIPRQQCVW